MSALSRLAFCLCLTLLVASMLACGSSASNTSTVPDKRPDTEPEPAKPTKSEPPQIAKPAAKKWYEGGTLHNRDAAAWKSATAENKLATCADFVASAWTRKMLKPEIQSEITQIDDMKPLAEKLLIGMEIAVTKKIPISDAKAFAKCREMNEFASVVMTQFKWFK